MKKIVFHDVQDATPNYYSDTLSCANNDAAVACISMNTSCNLHLTTNSLLETPSLLFSSPPKYVYLSILLLVFSISLILSLLLFNAPLAIEFLSNGKCAAFH